MLSKRFYNSVLYYYHHYFPETGIAAPARGKKRNGEINSKKENGSAITILKRSKESVAEMSCEMFAMSLSVLSIIVITLIMISIHIFALYRFLGGIKQYLCLSLLKNSVLSVMSIFQLLCSIFLGLLRFRSGLKEEIGIFFPMLVLRILENVLQPSFLQKMTVLNLVEKICQDPQIIIDVFVNYDCDVDAPNIFERYTFIHS